MFTKYVRLLLLLCSIVAVACNRSTVSLEFTNANKEVKQLQNLVFRFSQPLASDSLLNRWDSTEYVRFDPAIPGRFRWESPNQLVFSPEKPLAPATSYKATISKAVLEALEITVPSIKQQQIILEIARLSKKENALLLQLAELRQQYVQQQIIKAIDNSNG